MLAFKMKTPFCIVHKNVLGIQGCILRALTVLATNPFLLLYIEITHTQSEVNLHYKLQGMIIGIINALSIGSIGDSFILFSVECMLFQVI